MLQQSECHNIEALSEYGEAQAREGRGREISFQENRIFLKYRLFT